MRTLSLLFIAFICLIGSINAQEESTNKNKFRQLYQELPTPNSYRTASGAPGHEYWQQQADYKMSIELDDEKQIIHGEETITYFNNSPDILEYLWVQLDQNMRAKDSDTYKIKQSNLSNRMTLRDIKSLSASDFDGGFKLEYVQDLNGKPINHTVVKTMMRVDMPTVLNPGEQFSFKIKWWYNITDRMKIGGRSGFEYF